MQVTVELERRMSDEIPRMAIDRAIERIAKELADNYMTALQEGMIENVVTEDAIKVRLVEIMAKQIAEMKFNFKIKEPSVEPVSELVKENKESAVDGMRRMRGAKA